MTDLSALSRGAFVAEMLAKAANGWATLDALATCHEAARRLRLDSDLATRLAQAEVRVSELEHELTRWVEWASSELGGDVDDYNSADYRHAIAERFSVVLSDRASARAHARDLESQLAANGKGGEIKVGDRVIVSKRRERSSDITRTGKVAEVMYEVQFDYDGCCATYYAPYVTRLPPEPAKPVEPEWTPRIGDSVRITRGPFTGKVLTVVNIGVMGAIQVDTEGAGFIWTTAFEPPTEPTVEPAAEGKGVRRYGKQPWCPLTLEELWNIVPAYSPEADAVKHLREVLVSVAEIADELEKRAQNPSLVLTGDPMHMASRLRRLANG